MSLRKLFQEENDERCLDDRLSQSYYRGKIKAHTKINKMLEHFTTPEKLEEEIWSAWEASVDKCDANFHGQSDYRTEKLSQYNGERVCYFEMAERLEDIIKAMKGE